MFISAIKFNTHQKISLRKDIAKNTAQPQHNKVSQNMLPSFSYVPSFGYCEPHMRLMKTLNNKFADAISSVFQQYEEAQKQSNLYNNKLKISDNSHKTAAQMLAQYANYQYSMAEVIPSYAMESAPEIAEALSKTTIFTNPVDIMLTLNNIQNLETQTGIDKNTGKPYAQEQMRKSKANTQLYSTVLLLETLDKNLSISDIDDETKSRILGLRKNVMNSISDIYGEDAFDRIQKLKKMGSNASVEDKRASLNLVKEFDEKAQELVFADEFNEKLQNLVDYINRKENRTTETRNDDSVKAPVVTLKYHTHPQNMEHDHNHEHDHHHHNDLSHEQMHERGINHSHKDMNTNIN